MLNLNEKVATTRKIGNYI